MKKYIFKLKDGTEKTFDMTEDQRDCFVFGEISSEYACENCNNCKFDDLNNCENALRISDIVSIEEVKEEIVFEVGDKVEWLGVEGVVDSLTSDMGYGGLKAVMIEVMLDTKRIAFFEDGRYLEDQMPSLKLIEKAKKKITRTYTITEEQAKKIEEILK